MIDKIAKSIRYAKSFIREKLKSNGRSSKWNMVRDTFLAGHGACEACGSTKKLQVHHVAPFHLHPELELEESNLITLCMDENECHLMIGHGDSFKFYNPNVRDDARKFMTSGIEERKLLIEVARKNRVC